MKKIICALLVLSIAFTGLFVSCSGKNGGSSSTKVGVSMPTKDLQRWNQDGSNMKAQLEKAGYTVDLQFAANDINTQVSQLENMITSGCKVLVIASIDGNSLSNVLESAQKKNIKVIAYDRLIMNTKAVSYYATFDNYKVGTIQGDYLVDKLGLKSRSASDPVYMEFFTGDPGDNNATFFFNGALDVLRPYLDKGVIVCKSGQTEKAQCATLEWSPERAQSRMENLITSNKYGPKGQKLDAVMCSNDSTALGVTNALVSAGYTSANFPAITGQDCDIVNVKNMLKGLQSMSIFKDTRTLASKVVEMVDALCQGKKAPVNDTKTYNNNVKVVPSFLCDPVFADINNYKTILIDSGYYKESELK